MALLNTARTKSIENILAGMALPLTGAGDLDPLMERLAGARIVMIGEASHGTSEYYVWRARLSRRLIEEAGFDFVAVEGDWPDCYRVNRYIKGYRESGGRAVDVLRAYDRWPTWMWANWEVAAFAEWLRAHNGREADGMAGFYGLDVYSLWESMDAIVRHLDRADAETAQAARKAFECFEPFGRDEQEYARYTMKVADSCEDEAIRLLTELRRQAPSFDTDPEGAFDAEQNAHVMVNAERYYRTMMTGGGASWNLRDAHMLETLKRLMARHGPESKAIVWAHNTHVGDARATDMAASGMHNIGQLAREAFGDRDVRLVGFGSERGSVIAGSAWGARMEQMPVPGAMEASWESAMHRALGGNGLLLLDEAGGDRDFLRRRGHRAIGVVYRPRDEWGNYVPTVLPRRYDAFLFIDRSEALHPLHVRARDAATPPDTYPWGF